VSARRPADHREDGDLPLTRTLLDELLDHLDIAADGETERGERALEAVRARIARLSSGARQTLATAVAAQRADAELQLRVATDERDRLRRRQADWAAHGASAEGLADGEAAIRAAEAVVFEYTELVRELAEVAALLSAGSP
jgi:hypothetical protein